MLLIYSWLAQPNKWIPWKSVTSKVVLCWISPVPLEELLDRGRHVAHAIQGILALGNVAGGMGERNLPQTLAASTVVLSTGALCDQRDASAASAAAPQELVPVDVQEAAEERAIAAAVAVLWLRHRYVFPYIVLDHSVECV
jgi:hypothetical protein